MNLDTRLLTDRFPRSSRYHPDWVIANAMGSNVLWLNEWLASAIDLKPGMRLLHLGCGPAWSRLSREASFGPAPQASPVPLAANGGE